MLTRIFDGQRPLGKSDIAQMSIEEMSQLTYEAMIDVVLASEMPVRNVERIRTFEGETVSRLVQMAREHCRKNTATA